MNVFSKITATLFASAALFLTFSCSSGDGGGDEVITGNSSSSSINISSSSDDVLVSSSSEVDTGTSSSSSDDVFVSSSSVAVDKTALETKITEATTAKTGVVEASNGVNLFTNEFWVTLAQMTAITNAIATATTVNGNANATKAEVEAATAALNTAITTFNEAKQLGTVPLCGGDKYNLATEKCCGNDKYTTATYYCSNNAIKEYGWLTDSRGSGQTYKTIEIGTQIWMAENLNYNADGSKCYGNYEDNCDTYGRLYNWKTAMDGAATSTANPSGVQGVCPSGWHLPSDAEWDVLMASVGGVSTAGTKLKAAEGWNSNGNGTDEFGFAALPGGLGGSGGQSAEVGNDGHWWSATEYSAYYAYFRSMSYNNENIYWGYNLETYLYSIRCVKD